MSQGMGALLGLCASSMNCRKKSGAPVAFELSQTNRGKPGAPVRQSLIYKGTGATGAAQPELEQAGNWSRPEQRTFCPWMRSAVVSASPARVIPYGLLSLDAPR